MPRGARRDLVLWLGVVACALAVGLAGSRDVFWSGDFVTEAYPAYQQLMAGDVHGYLHSLPGYSGFALLVGAPAALLGALVGGQETAVYRLCAVPGLAALAWLAVALAREARSRGLKGWPLVLALSAGGPLVLRTVIDGHPEDLLATAAVGAVLAARRGRPVTAALLLVAAVASKQWALLAFGPALLAAPAGHRRIALIAGAGALAVIGAQMLWHPLARGVLTNSGALFHPQQVWWPFGVPATHDFTAAGHGVRMGPAWLQPLTHPLIMALAIPLSVLHWRSGRRELDDAFGLLALLFLLRCMLDPWDVGYYHLPLVTALIAWEVRRGRDWPLLGLAASAAVWLTFVTNHQRTTDTPFVAYLAWTLPLLALLARELYGRRAPLRSRRPWPVDPTSGARRSSPSTSTT